MSIFRAVHVTKYEYEAAVMQCMSETRLTPRSCARQTVKEHRLTVHPAPARIHRRKDYFGNEVVCFAVAEPHRLLTVTSESILEIAGPDQGPAPKVAWRDARRMLAERRDLETMEASEYLWESPFVPWIPELKAYAAPVFEDHEDLCEAAHALMRRIFRDFKYAPKATSIETPLAKVLEERQGVCQDYAHAMIGAMRAHGLAARYVSGYLRGDVELQGAQASHAWVSVFVPGWGWRDYDPTNDMEPAGGHLTVAWGRDYGDVPPVKGLTVGGGEHKLDVEVRVRKAG